MISQAAWLAQQARSMGLENPDELPLSAPAAGVPHIPNQRVETSCKMPLSVLLYPNFMAAQTPAPIRLMTAQERRDLISNPPQRTQVSLRMQRDILRGTVPPPPDWLPTKTSTSAPAPTLGNAG
jgi:hypothetical protein